MRVVVRIVVRILVRVVSESSRESSSSSENCNAPFRLNQRSAALHVFILVLYGRAVPLTPSSFQKKIDICILYIVTKYLYEKKKEYK